MPTSIFDTVRRDAQFVVAKASHVRVNEQRLEEVTAKLKAKPAPAPAWDPEQHFLGDKETMAAFVVQFSAINFGISSHSPVQTSKGLSAYRTVADAMTRRFASHGPLTTAQLCQATPAFCASLLNQRLGNAGIDELMQQYAQGFAQLGQFLERQNADSVMQWLQKKNNCAQAVVTDLISLPMYQDVAQYKGKSVSFYARAQMCVSDLDLALQHQAPAQFDITALTAFANETVPHLLHARQILEYSQALEQTVEQGVMLPAGSAEEVEIRAASIVAIDRIARGMSTKSHRVTARDVDFLLWREAEAADVAQMPSHWTKTIFY